MAFDRMQKIRYVYDIKGERPATVLCNTFDTDGSHLTIIKTYYGSIIAIKESLKQWRLA